MENTVKKTKAMYFLELRDMVAAAVEDNDLREELINFLDAQINAIEKRKVFAQKRAEQKREESDIIMETIYAQIGNEPITVDQILVALNDDSLTRNKVVSRLSKLVKMGWITKESVKVEGGRRMAYVLANLDEDNLDESEAEAEE